MAETKETVIVDFQINEGAAIKSLENTKKSIVELKAQQTELNKAYKDGTKNLDEYAKESVQLEAALKKQQAQYSTIQRSVTGLKNPFDKLNESIKEQAKQVSVAGVSLSSFVNPATAAVTVLGSLFKAYASSTIGAKDLEFASNQLSSAFGLLSNEMASLVSTGEDGEGFFTNLLNTILKSVGPAGSALAYASKGLAMMKEEIEDLGREELTIRGEINERLEQNAEKLAKIQDSQTAYYEKIALAGEAIANLRKNEDDLVAVKQKQLDIINRMLEADPENDKLKDTQKEKENEISRIKSDVERKVQNIIKLESNLKDVEDKRVEATKKADEAEVKSAEDAHYQRLKRLDQERIAQELAIEIANAEKADKEQEVTNKIVAIGNERLKQLKALYDKNTKNYKGSKDDQAKIDKLANQIAMQNAVLAFNAVAGLFEEGTAAHKVATLAQLTVDTAAAISSLTANSEANPANAVTFGGAGVLQYTLGLVRIFANIGQAAQILSKAAGGGSFMTKGPQLLLVGDNPGGVERVDVTPISGKGKTVVGPGLTAMAGGGTMYTGGNMPWFPFGMQFTDAGIMANSLSSSQSQMAAMQPKVTLSYSEFLEFQNMVNFKESMATA